MKVKISSFILVLSSAVFALSLPELPWDKVSIGIMDQEGTSATFQKGNFTYGLDAMTFAISMDLVGLSGFSEDEPISSEESSYNCDYDWYNCEYYGYDCCEDEIYEDEDEDEDEDRIGGDVSASARIFMPKIGYRLDLRSNNRISTYYSTEVYILIPILSLEVDSGSGSEDNEINDAFEEATEDVRDVIDSFGLKLGYGVEYGFNEQLSLSADIGFDWIFNNIDIGDLDLKSRMGNTFTKLSLNFSF